MPATKAKRPATPKKKPAAARKRPTTNGKHQQPTAVERTTELSEEMFQSLEDSARSALEAVRKFVEIVDEKLPPSGAGRSDREEITDSALQMAEKLVHTQYEFLRKVVDSAGKALARSDQGK